MEKQIETLFNHDFTVTIFYETIFSHSLAGTNFRPCVVVCLARPKRRPNLVMLVSNTRHANDQKIVLYGVMA